MSSRENPKAQPPTPSVHGAVRRPGGTSRPRPDLPGRRPPGLKRLSISRGATDDRTVPRGDPAIRVQFSPVGWALCDGQLLPISSNSALFSLLGTYYGGDGVRTFALPNLQGRVAIHQGDGAGLSPYVMGQSGGSEDETLNVNQMPAHNHEVLGHNGPSNSTKPLGRVPATTSTDAYASAPSTPWPPA